MKGFVVVQSLSHAVTSNSLQPHNSMPGFPVPHSLSEIAQIHVHWISDAIQPSHLLVTPFSSCPQAFPASVSFLVSQLFTSGGQSIGALASASVLQVNIHWRINPSCHGLWSSPYSKVGPGEISVRFPQHGCSYPHPSLPAPSQPLPSLAFLNFFY